MSVCKDGLNRMFSHIERATGDIKHRLWTLYWLARLVPEITGVPRLVELGVRQGDSTHALLSGCLDRGDSTSLWSYDCENFDHSVQDSSLREHWVFSVKDSVSAELEWNWEVSLVFIDTDHTFTTTSQEIGAWHQHVAVGGCMAFHDYWLHDPPRDKWQGHGVKMAVDAFANAHADSWRLETHDAVMQGDTGFAILWRVQ
jgi:hypothetical protein